jgi:ABC-type multidrug transport system fused ATPase/permease subunit
VLLDEVSSALNAELEKVVQDALDGVIVDQTIITVAHRLSTIMGANLIAVMNESLQRKEIMKD